MMAVLAKLHCNNSYITSITFYDCGTVTVQRQPVLLSWTQEYASSSCAKLYAFQ